MQTYPNNVSSARFSSEHAQNARAASDVKDGLALEEMCIVNDSGTV